LQSYYIHAQVQVDEVLQNSLAVQVNLHLSPKSCYPGHALMHSAGNEL